VVLSDGDAAFPPHKARRSGLWEAVQGRELIYLHKEKMLEEVRREFPAQHYIMMDDKLRILSAMKRGGARRISGGSTCQRARKLIRRRHPRHVGNGRIRRWSCSANTPGAPSSRPPTYDPLSVLRTCSLLQPSAPTVVTASQI
jgi:hypothetical protein